MTYINNMDSSNVSELNIIQQSSDLGLGQAHVLSDPIPRATGSSAETIG